MAVIGRRFKKSNTAWTLFLNFCGAKAIAMPWRTCYVHPNYVKDREMIRHEHVHFDQMDRDGTLMFCLKYLHYQVRYGYWQNPYEIEARQKSARNKTNPQVFNPIAEHGNL